MRKLVRLFFECFRISLFVVGGGYAIISVADEVFARLKWTEEGEVLGQLPVFQMVPGLIAGNTAIYVGNKVAGPLGAAVALLGVMLPSLAIFLAVSVGYEAIPLDNPWLESAFVGLRAALTGIIAAVIWKGWDKGVKGPFGYAMVFFCAVAIALRLANPALVLVGAALCGLGVYGMARRFNSTALPVIAMLFLKYGAAAFGGGYVLVPFYMADFVGPAAPYLQMAADEFANVMALTQMTPGPIAINCATFFGYRLGGIGGAGVATAALLVPSYFLLLGVLRALERFKTSKTVAGIMFGLRPATFGMMICALISFAKFSVLGYNTTSILIFLSVFVLTIRRKMSAMTLIFVSAVLATVARADDVTLEKYPDADAVVLEQREYSRYNPDGTFSATDEIWIKVLTEKGRRDESVLNLSYSKRYGTARVDFVGVIGTNGVERAIDFANTTKDVSDNSSMAENIYDSMARKLTCTVPEVKLNETVHYKYTRTVDQSRIENQYASSSVMEWECPILKSSVVLDAPKERPLKKIAIRHPLKDHLSFRQEEKDGRILYIWESNYPTEQVFPDPDMPPLYTQVENIRYSTAENWEEISRWYWEVSAPHLAKTNAAISNKVDEIGHDISKIYKWVAQEIRYMGLTMEDKSPGYAPHDVDITFNHRYGVCRDKAALLVAMLRIAGFDAYPVLIHNGAKQDPDVPMPYFNHAIVSVKKDGEIILMDPTDESSRDLMPSYLSDKSYIIATPEGDPLRTSPIVSPKENSLVIDSNGTLEASGAILLKMALHFNGINDNSFRSSLVRKSLAGQRSLFQSFVRARYAGAELLKLDISPSDLQDTTVPLQVNMVVRLPDMLLSGKTRDELTPPMFSMSLGVVNWLLSGKTSLDKRRFPLVLDTTASIEEHISLQLSGVVGETAKLPADINIAEPYAFSRAFRIEGDTLKADTIVSIGKIEFSPDEYQAIREEEKRIEISHRDRLLFDKDVTHDANVRYLYVAEETGFTGDRSWVVTNTCVKEILTYDGKKSSSELKFYYNPTWSTTMVLSACVSNRNGTVSWLNQHKEINIMDVTWAGEAPRYPASKTMVVNLPSVEVGSVISYTTVTTVKDAPVEFYGDWYFDTYDPIDELYVRCGDWERREFRPRRLARENMLPNAAEWRDHVIISSNSFSRQCAVLKPAITIEPYSFPEAGTTIEEIRNWMVKNVRVIGPGLYEVPLEFQLTPAATVISERYGNRLDYMRTLAAVLKGAGYEAEVVFATIDSGVSRECKERNMYYYPDVAAFDAPIVRVGTLRTPGWKRILSLGLAEKQYEYTYIGLENQYTPIGTTNYDYSHYFNPADDTFNLIMGDAKLAGSTHSSVVMSVNADGSVDMQVEGLTSGLGVGAFRQKYAEMLPEDRSRHFQTLISRISSSAEPVGDFVTDTESYPARLNYRCRIPDFAMVKDGTITVSIPDFYTQLFPLSSGSSRQSPIGIPAQGRDTVVYTVEFPEGYTLVERLPEAYAFSDPATGTGKWLENFVSTKMEDGKLKVYVWREQWDHIATMLGKDYFGLLKDWNRISSSRANRTISVRKSE